MFGLFTFKLRLVHTHMHCHLFYYCIMNKLEMKKMSANEPT